MYPTGFNVFIDYSVDLRSCYRSERSSSIFIFIRSTELRVCSKYLMFEAWVLFLEQTNISEIFKIVSRGNDKR